LSLFQKSILNSIKQDESLIAHDAMVYALYGLSEDEIGIVEGKE
jgi:hypothetical protein